MIWHQNAQKPLILVSMLAYLMASCKVWNGMDPWNGIVEWVFEWNIK